jgi:hypothetical protein
MWQHRPGATAVPLLRQIAAGGNFGANVGKILTEEFFHK